MLHFLNFKIFSAVLILVITLFAGLLPFCHKKIKQQTQKKFTMSAALASGIFLGAGLIHMLSDAAYYFSKAGYHYPFAFLLTGLTFLFLLFLEHISLDLRKHQDDTSIVTLIALIMLSFHSILAGTALGVSHSYSATLLVLFAIVAHKWAESFAMASQICDTHLNHKTQIIYFTLFALMTPMGILIGDTLIHQLTFSHEPLEAIFQSLAAGTFIYIGTLHGLNRIIMADRCCSIKEFGWSAFGFALMAIVAIWL
jgi:solute carrier family 39 (zinc transporter), member 1/2/3